MSTHHRGNQSALWRGLSELVRPKVRMLLASLSILFVNRACSLVIPASTKWLIDDVMDGHRMSVLPKVIGLVLSATFIQGLTSYVLTQMLSKGGQRAVADLRRKVQEHVGRLPIAYHDRNAAGKLVTQIMADVEGIGNLIGAGVIDLFGGVLTASFAFAFLLRISITMTMLATLTLALFAYIMWQMMAKIKAAFQQSLAVRGEVTARLMESVAAVRVVKGYHAESRESAVFTAGANRILEAGIRTTNAHSIFSLISIATVGVVSIPTILIGAHEVFHQRLTPAEYATYILFLAFLVFPVLTMVTTATQIAEALSGFERTLGILCETDEYADKRRSLELPTLRGLVVFHDVGFEYDLGTTVLSDIRFVAQPGTVTALVGPSGAGKSTIASLLCAFHTATRGKILVDGFDLSTAKLSTYRSQLGVVLQETFLFDGTIKENVVFSRPGASEEDFLKACRISRLDDFALSFREGYETLIGERGVKLSGGQRQRLAIARAVLADPRILIFDEATSSLDSENESLIQQAMRELIVGRTTFIIAHRLSTIQKADQILVMEQGLIVERGTHTELLQRQGRYRDLYTLQQVSRTVPGLS